MTADDIDSLCVHMALRCRVTARRQLDDMLIRFVVAIEVAKRAFDAVAFAWPGTDFDGLHVLNVNAADQRGTLALAPLLIHVEPGERRLLFRIEIIAIGGHGHSSKRNPFAVDDMQSKPPLSN